MGCARVVAGLRCRAARRMVPTSPMGAVSGKHARAPLAAAPTAVAAWTAMAVRARLAGYGDREEEEELGEGEGYEAARERARRRAAVDAELLELLESDGEVEQF